MAQSLKTLEAARLRYSDVVALFLISQLENIILLKVFVPITISQVSFLRYLTNLL